MCVCLSVCLERDTGRSFWLIVNKLGPYMECYTRQKPAVFLGQQSDNLVTRLKSRWYFKIVITPSNFKLERRSKAQNVGNCIGYPNDAIKFRWPACVITWLCTDSPLPNCYIVLLITSKHPTHSNTGTVTVAELSCTHSFPHNDPMHGFGDECVQYYSQPKSCTHV